MGFRGRRIATCLKNAQVFVDLRSELRHCSPTSELPYTPVFMLVAALPLAGAALAPAVPGVGAWHAARSLAYLRSSTITAQAPKQASGAAAEAEGTRDAEGAYDPSTWAPPSAADQVDAPSICSLIPDPSTKTNCCPAKPKADSNTNPVHACRKHQFQFAHERQPEP